jgi:hypothetical protein
MYRGDDRTFVLTLTADGAPMDLSAATIRFTARRRITDEPLIELTLGTGIALVTDGTDGQIALSIARAVTEPFEGRVDFVWDLEITSGDVVRTWPESSAGAPELGRLQVLVDASRPVVA